MTKISALVCARNEEKVLAGCLSRLGWGVLIAVMAGLFAFLSVLRARLILAERGKFPFYEPAQ